MLILGPIYQNLLDFKTTYVQTQNNIVKTTQVRAWGV